MAELDLTAPTALTTGVVSAIIAGDVTPSQLSCNLSGTGTLSWLLQFDTAAGTLKTGGARPVMDPTTGYAFDDETIMSLHVQPIVYNAKPDATGNFSTMPGQDLVFPIFLDLMGTQTLLLPIRSLVFTMGTLSPSQNCIGSYNAAGLDPANSCQTDSTHPLFLDGGSMRGFIALADADAVTISALQESLCVLLTGDAAMYGDGAKPVAHCKKDGSGNIVFRGDWCSSTNAAATATCADSVTLGGNFAASSVLITN